MFSLPATAKFLYFFLSSFNVLDCLSYSPVNPLFAFAWSFKTFFCCWTSNFNSSLDKAWSSVNFINSFRSLCSSFAILTACFFDSVNLPSVSCNSLFALISFSNCFSNFSSWSSWSSVASVDSSVAFLVFSISARKFFCALKKRFSSLSIAFNNLSIAPSSTTKSEYFIGLPSAMFFDLFIV